LLEIDGGCCEQGLNLNAGSTAELCPLETVLGLEVGHDALADDLPATESALSKTAGDVDASTL